MAVIPVGARLAHGEFVGEGLARPDPRKADARHAVILERHQQPMPVHRAVDIERIGDIEANSIAFGQADQRSRHAAVDRDTRAAPPLDDAMAAADREIDLRPAHLVEAGRNARAAAPVASAVHAVALRPGGHGGQAEAAADAGQDGSSGKISAHGSCLSSAAHILYPPMVCNAILEGPAWPRTEPQSSTA